MPDVAAVNAHRRVPVPVNEPVCSYAPGTAERAALKARLDAMATERIEIPLIIGGAEVRTGKMRPAVMPFKHSHVLADYHLAEPKQVQQAVAAALKARRDWAAWPLEDRAAILLRAADLLSTTFRDTVNAATMLNQAKTVFQSEIDAVCELIDFWRFNVSYAHEIHGEQPISSPGVWNQLEYRGLEGFVYAVSPFNFTSIGGNLSTAPVLMGGVSIWKPASSAMLSAYYLMKVLEAAGLPPGVINFVPGPAGAMTDHLLASPDLAGIHFTGSTDVFQSMWKTVGANIHRYRSYPRLVGETGGKDFIMVHPSADPQQVAVAIVRGGFEYQGQKCSAASRVYIPQSLWKDVRDRTVAMMKAIKMGDPRDFRNFMSAVIDRNAFDKISGYLARANRGAKVIQGGGADDRTGYFIEPTLVQATRPDHVLLCEEVFGPVVTAYVYPDAKFRETMRVLDRTSPYALTGSIFATDREAIREATSALRNAAGNFYINDKPTGAVVGQQPFGGARASGTNDKAGSKLNLLRWVNTRTIKETFVPPSDFRYPFMEAK
jgi:1-pyrroline-5-carboxylate dehydrogenase